MGEPGQYVLVEVGAERVGMPLDEVCAPFALPDHALVPWSPPWVTGAIHHDGQIVMVVDLARFAGLGDAGPRPSVFVPFGGERQLAFAVRAATLVAGRPEVRGQTVNGPRWFGPEHSVAGVTFQPVDLTALLTQVAEAL